MRRPACTPPINTFEATLKNGKLCIGGAEVMEVGAKHDGPLVAAIRPEGFIPASDGVLNCTCRQIEVMGRDTSIVCEHPCFTGDNFRAIVDAEDISKVTDGRISFNLKLNKVFLFDANTGDRIYF